MLLFGSLVVGALGSMAAKCDASDPEGELCLLQLNKPGTARHLLSPRKPSLAFSDGQASRTVSIPADVNHPWINEFHYQNKGNDVNEGVEIGGLKGTNLNGYKVLFYDGKERSQYGSMTLDGVLEGEGDYGFLWFAAAGRLSGEIQNGAGQPDAIALVHDGSLVPGQFWSYGSGETQTFTAQDGAIAGATSVSMHTAEGKRASSEESLHLAGEWPDFHWEGDSPASHDVHNEGQIFPESGSGSGSGSGSSSITTSTASTREECAQACAGITSAGGFPFINGYGDEGALGGGMAVAEGGLHQAIDELCELYYETWTHPVYGHVSTWNVSQVTNMEILFGASKDCIDRFDADISCWDTSNVRVFSYMFHPLKVFNQPLNCWDTSSGEKFTSTFHGADVFNQPLNLWDMSKAWNVIHMFAYAEDFDRAVNAWDTSSVKYMLGMFKGATSFNRALDNWNVENVLSMSDMFKDAKAFNQDLSNWNPAAVIRHTGMFTGADAFTHSFSPFA